MLSVFLSHSSRDKPCVRELAHFLAQDGYIKVWLDEGEISPGANIVAEIAEELGDKGCLQAWLSNQAAVILQVWGRLEEALAFA